MRGFFAWLVVAAVGAVVIVLVLGLQLFPRLSAGQDVIDTFDPVHTDERVAGLGGGADILDKIVDLADPLATSSGTGAKEVEPLIGLVTKKTGLSAGEVAAALRKEAPHTEALLRTLPLSGVSAEIPGLLKFLAATLKMSEEEVLAALNTSFPRLAQSIAALPKVTGGWDAVPGIEGMTRFDGTPVKNVPGVRDYFAGDVVPAVVRQKENFQDVSAKGGVGYIPLLLLVVGAVVLLYGILMALRARGGNAPGSLAWSVVLLVGVVIVGLVLVLSYFPRLNGADEVIDEYEPIFTEQRVQGAKAGIDIVSDVVDLSDPIVLAKGGGAAEVPKLVAFVAKEADLSEAAVLGALRDNAPRTLALLQTIPLEDVAEEVPGLLAFLAKTLDVSGDELLATLMQSTPGLAQALLSVGPVTAGWDKVPKAEKLTRFDGDPATTVPGVRDYLAQDVIPAVVSEREDFDKLANTWPPVNVFGPLLLVVGALVTLYGLLGVLTARKGSAA